MFIREVISHFGVISRKLRLNLTVATNEAKVATKSPRVATIDIFVDFNLIPHVACIDKNALSRFIISKLP